MGFIRNKPSTNLLENPELTAKLYDAYEALSSDKNFITLMDEGFLQSFASNQVGMLSHPEVAANKNNDSEVLLNNLRAVSAVENYFIVLERLGPQAKEAIRRGEELDAEEAETVETLEEEVGV